MTLRSQIVLAAADGRPDSSIAEQLDIHRKTVRLWRARFAEQGMEGLWEVAPGRGRKPSYSLDKIKAIVDATLQTKPKGMTHWSCRLMAESQEVSKSTVSNIWRSHNLKPYRVKALQVVARLRVSGETHGCGGTLSESSAAGHSVVCR